MNDQMNLPIQISKDLESKTISIDTLQLIDMLSVGILVLNQQLEIVLWNRWMEDHSNIPKNQAIGKVITDLFPDLKARKFPWKVQAVFKLGHFSFFPQEHYKYLFYFPTRQVIQTSLKEMQQNCIVSPLKNSDGVVEYVAVSVYDVTDTVDFQQQLIKAKKMYENLSLMDELTGVYNRRHLWSRLQEEFARYQRTQQALSFLLLDIDHFKSINDLYGHLAGDSVLKRLCQFIVDSLRKYDIVGRYGGEEFGIILPNTNLSFSVQVAERLRQGVEKTNFAFGEKNLPVTISIGVAEANLSIMSIEKFINHADEALYKAKNDGRNRVCY